MLSFSTVARRVPRLLRSYRCKLYFAGFTSNPPSDRRAAVPIGNQGRVFISYGRVDRDAADFLFRLRRERDVAAWYDALIEPAADWRDAIVEHLGSARIMVVLLSSAALESEVLKKELAVADQEGVPLFGRAPRGCQTATGFRLRASPQQLVRRL